MNFQNLQKVEIGNFYLDLALRKAQKRLTAKRESLSKLESNKLAKSRKMELLRLDIFVSALNESLMHILKSFPSLDNLPLFYNELVKLTLDYVEVKQGLGALNWAHERIGKFHNEYTRKINAATQITLINKKRGECIGRISSVIKQIKSAFSALENARRTMKGYPTIKTETFTVAIAGFPNVGKTTLLNKLTKAEAKIAAYAFTTQGINIGYSGEGKSRIQFLDTPGTLNRFEKMNMIERQAYLAIKYCTDLIVYVYDLTEASYPIAGQIQLHKQLKKDFDKPMIVYLSKMDMLKDNFNAMHPILQQLKSEFNAVETSEELANKIIPFVENYAIEQQKKKKVFSEMHLDQES